MCNENETSVLKISSVSAPCSLVCSGPARLGPGIMSDSLCGKPSASTGVSMHRVKLLIPKDVQDNRRVFDEFCYYHHKHYCCWC